MNPENRIVHFNLRIKTVKKGHLSVPHSSLKSDQNRSKQTN